MYILFYFFSPFELEPQLKEHHLRICLALKSNWHGLPSLWLIHVDLWLEVVIDVCGHGFCLKSAIMRQLEKNMEMKKRKTNKKSYHVLWISCFCSFSWIFGKDQFKFLSLIVIWGSIGSYCLRWLPNFNFVVSVFPYEWFGLVLDTVLIN